jgi:hypothetical protein
MLRMLQATSEYRTSDLAIDRMLYLGDGLLDFLVAAAPEEEARIQTAVQAASHEIRALHRFNHVVAESLAVLEQRYRKTPGTGSFETVPPAPPTISTLPSPSGRCGPVGSRCQTFGQGHPGAAGRR